MHYSLLVRGDAHKRTNTSSVARPHKHTLSPGSASAELQHPPRAPYPARLHQELHWMTLDFLPTNLTPAASGGRDATGPFLRNPDVHIQQ